MTDIRVLHRTSTGHAIAGRATRWTGNRNGD